MTFHASETGIYLHHLAVGSRKPDRLAAFYADVMDMMLVAKGPTTWRCEGPERRVIFKEGEDKSLLYAGFACRNHDALSKLQAHVESGGLETFSSPSFYFGKEAFSLIDPDGNRICFGLTGSDERRSGIRGPIQHLTFASLDVEAFQAFYHGKVGFAVTDRVLHDDGSLATCFTTANHEHHSIACFKSHRQGMDHHSYEAGEWITIRDWCDHFAGHDVQLMWGPGRHGPGNNLFVFIEDPDGNWIEVSAELETVKGRPTKDWPQAERTLNLWGQAIMRS